MFKTVKLPVNIKQFEDNPVKLDDVKKFLNDNKEDDKVKKYLGELSAVSADKVKGFLETDEGKKILQPKLDANFNKGLSTWKENNLEKLIDEEVKKRNPDKSPEQKEIEKLNKKIEEAEKARNRENLTNKALKIADEKSLPKGVVDYFVGDDEEKTVSNLGKLEEEFNAAVTKAVEAKFKEGGRNPEDGNNDNSGGGASIDLSKLAGEASITN